MSSRSRRSRARASRVGTTRSSAAQSPQARRQRDPNVLARAHSRFTRNATLIALLLAVLVGGALLLVAGVGFLGSSSLGAAATIDGRPIDRADFRARASALEAIAAVRQMVFGDWVRAGDMTSDQATTLESQYAPSDVVAATVQSLASGDVVDKEAGRLGVKAPRGVNPKAEVTAELEAEAARRVRWIELDGPQATAGSMLAGWPVAMGPTTSASTESEAIAYAAGQLGTGTVPDLVAAGRGAGWNASGGELWIPATGAVDGMPSALVAQLRAAAVGTAVGPFRDDITGAQVVGLAVTDHPALDAAAVGADLAAAGIDLSGLGAWASAYALEGQLRARELSDWTTKPVNTVAAAEIVVGSVANGGVDGPFVGLSGLVLRPAGEAASGPSPMADVAGVLRGLDLADRLARWDQLVTQANARPGLATNQHSGEIGWVAQPDLLPAVATAAFASTTKAGDILGPVDTPAGSELFLVRGVYAGPLDDITNAALTEVMSSTDLDATAATVSGPFPDSRYTIGVERSEPEVLGNTAADQALFGGPLGVRGGPYGIDGSILVAVPRTRSQALPSGQLLDRIEAAAFEDWLAGQTAGLPVEVVPNPLGLPGAASQAPALSFGPAETPYQPVIPGLPSP